LNFEKFKSLPFGKKVQWIAQYYGIWIIVAIIGIGVAVSFLHSVFFPEPISDVCVIVLSDDYDRDEIPEIEGEISARIDGSASLQIYNTSEVYGNSAFSIKLLSDQIDLVLAPKEETSQMTESGYLASSEQIGDKDFYIGIPDRARSGEKLDKTIEYFKERESK